MEIGKASRGKLRIHELGPVLEFTFLLVNGLTMEVKRINEQLPHQPTKKPVTVWSFRRGTKSNEMKINGWHRKP